MKRILFILGLLFWLSCNVYATNYYVAASGGNDSNAGTTGSRWATIQKCASTMVAGDTCVVGDGTYTSSSDRLVDVNSRIGTNANWITFRSENKWGAVLDGQSWTKQGAFLIGSHHTLQTQYTAADDTRSFYIKIEDFEIKNFVRYGISVGNACSLTTSHDCDTVSVSGGAQHIYLHRNKIHNIGTPSSACGSDSGQGRSAILGGLYDSYVTIDSNIVYNIGRTPGSCSTDDYNKDQSLYIKSSHTGIFNNVFYNNLAGWNVILDGTSDVPGGITDIVVANNTFDGKNPQREGHIFIAFRVLNLTIADNISYNPGAAFIETTDLNMVCVAPNHKCWEYYGSNHFVYNNLIYGTGNPSIYTYTPTVNWTASGNITGQNPLFVNQVGRDYHLQYGSPAINAGIDTSGYSSYLTTDYDGVARPQNTLWDIGAYELQALSPPTGLTAGDEPGDTGGQIVLNWNVSSTGGVTEQRIYRGTSPGVHGTLVTTIYDNTTTQFIDSGLTNGTTYYYVIRAYNGSESGDSNEANAIPVDNTVPPSFPTPPPTLLTIADVSGDCGGSLLLTWTPSSDASTTEQRIYRSVVTSQYYSLVKTFVDKTIATWTDTSATLGTRYYYIIKAYNSAGESLVSNEISGTSVCDTIPVVVRGQVYRPVVERSQVTRSQVPRTTVSP